MLPRTESADEEQIHVLEIAGNAIVGGMEKYVYSLVQNLPASHFKVSVLTIFESSFTASLRQLGCEVYITRMEDNPPWRSIQFATELIRHSHVDIIHAHLPRAHVLAGITANITGIPAVATVHGMDINPLDLGVCRTTGTNLTVVCQEAYSQALSLGVPPERLALIPNGADTKIFLANRTGASFRKALHISPSTPLVGYVGRLAWEKGPDDFIRLAEVIHHDNPEVHFAIVGEGPMEDELKDMIKAAHLDNFVHLAGIWTNTWEVYPAFDVLAQTSRVEGMPFALLEGMACGRPVAAYGVGGVPEIVEVNTTGILSAGGDWEGLAHGIVRLLANPELVKQMGHASRKRIEENFDWQNSVRRMIHLWYRLLGKKAPKDLLLQPQTPWSMVKPEDSAVEIDSTTIFPKRK